MAKQTAILAEPVLSGLYAITDHALMPGEQLFLKTEAALRGGCRVIQYRNKIINRLEQKREVQRLRDLCDRYRSLFIINDHVDLALESGADGVHIGQTDRSLQDVRQQLGDGMLIGVSCHSSLELAKQAERDGASYVAFGRFFPSRTKPDAPPAEPDILRRAKQQLQIPVVAIGGITRDNAPRLIEQGADMIAVIHDLFSANDVESRARTFIQLFSSP